jgi:hypothetical protein
VTSSSSCAPKILVVSGWWGKNQAATRSFHGFAGRRKKATGVEGQDFSSAERASVKFHSSEQFVCLFVCLFVCVCVRVCRRGEGKCSYESNCIDSSSATYFSEGVDKRGNVICKHFEMRELIIQNNYFKCSDKAYLMVIECLINPSAKKNAMCHF